MKRICNSIWLLFWFCTLPLSAQDNQVYQISFEGIDYAYNMEFDKALNRFDAIINIDPQNPHGHLLKAISHYYLYLVDMENKSAESSFRELAATTSEVAQKRLQRNRDDQDAMFALGTINMYLAAYYGENNGWMRAYWYGKEGINYLEALTEKNPAYYDAYLGLGLYHYYAAVMPKLVKAISFLLGVEADRRRGLQELEVARQKGTYASVEAKFFLGYIYLYLEKNYQKAVSYFRELCDVYPNNPVFRIVLGDSYRKFGKHDLAIAAYKQSVADPILKRFPRLVNSSHYLMGNIYFEKNDLKSAIEMYELAVENAAKFPNADDGVYSWGLYKQGECYEMLGSRELAESFYKRVKKDDNKFAYEKAVFRLKNPMLKVDADLIRARNYLITHQFDEAIAIYRDVIPQLSSTAIEYPLERLPELYYNIGRAKFEMKDYASAVDDFKKVLSIKETPEKWILPWTHYRIGRCYQHLGRVSDALTHYKLAYKYDDGDLRFEIDKINRELKGSF
ncbi:MAG: tetratricopeptide repeat protein [Deferribacteres bacterium]|nr:tetratricopeptide repeat protein [Deferribacteres bacterium]